MTDIARGYSPGTGASQDMDQVAKSTGTVDIPRVQIIGRSTDFTDVVQPLPHDAADSGPSIKIGGKANIGAPAAVSADNDRADLWVSRHGQLVVVPEAVLGSLYIMGGGRSSIMTAVKTATVAAGVPVEVIAAPGANIYTYVLGLTLTVATTTSDIFTFKNTAGTTILTYYLRDNCAISQYAPSGVYLAKIGPNTQFTVDKGTGSSAFATNVTYVTSTVSL